MKQIIENGEVQSSEVRLYKHFNYPSCENAMLTSVFTIGERPPGRQEHHGGTHHCPRIRLVEFRHHSDTQGEGTDHFPYFFICIGSFSSTRSWSRNQAYPAAECAAPIWFR